MQDENKNDNKRTTQEQLKYFVDFLKDHPELMARKNNSADPERVKNLWSQLGGTLNALNGPTRSSTKWKETLSHWKNQVRSRTRMAKVHRATNGGGPPSSIKLKDFDERALEAFELKDIKERALEAFEVIAVDGLPSMPTLGIQNIVKVEEIIVTPSQESEDNHNDTIYENKEFQEDSFVLPSQEQERVRDPRKNERRAALPKKPRKNTNLSTFDLVNQILRISQQNSTMARESLEVQKSMADEVKNMADALKQIADSLKSLSDAVTDTISK